MMLFRVSMCWRGGPLRTQYILGALWQLFMSVCCRGVWGTSARAVYPGSPLRGRQRKQPPNVYSRQQLQTSYF